MAAATVPITPTTPAAPAVAAAGATPGAKSLPTEHLRAMSRVTEISSLPEITTRIVEVVEDPAATAHDMHEIVKTDPALATKILKVVNSAFYGLPSQIASLDRAIVMLGLSAVKNIALAASLSRLFKAEQLSDHFAVRDLWRHCLSVGVCAKLLAGATRTGPAEELFVAGLVHDLGLIVEHQLYPDSIRAISHRCYAEPLDFCSIEREMIGADHEAFGLALATKWKFPPLLRNAIAYHHESSTLQPEFRRTVALITVSDAIACQQQIGYWLTARATEINPELLDMATVTGAQISQVVETLVERVDEAERIFS